VRLVASSEWGSKKPDTPSSITMPVAAGRRRGGDGPPRFLVVRGPRWSATGRILRVPRARSAGAPDDRALRAEIVIDALKMARGR
jgi:hypothetical protein